MNLFNCSGGGASQKNFVYIHQMIICGEPGNYRVKVTLSMLQRIKALLGIGPNEKQLESWARANILGEEKEPAK